MKTKSDFAALMSEFESIDRALPATKYMGIADENCIHQNVMDGNPEKPLFDSEEYWYQMYSAAKMFAGMIAENHGMDINALIGRTIY